MDEGSILSCIIILVLLFFSAYFAVCETAFATISKARLKFMQERGDRRSIKALYVVDNFSKAITTLLIGTNIVCMTLSAYITVIVTRQWGIGAVTVSTIITTIIVFLLGEMLPKSLGKKYSEQFALSTASSLCFLMRIFSPVSHVLTSFGNAVASITKGESTVSVTEDELHDIVDNMTDEGELDFERGELVKSALTFGELTVESVLTSRVDLHAIDIEMEKDEIVDIIKSTRHSRLPVYEGSIDNIIGILQIRKYIKTYLETGAAPDIRSILDEAYFVHSSAKIDELLQVLSSRKTYMAIVADSYGGTLGIITVEDILEELVGEIWDEDDEEIVLSVKNPDDSFTFDASVDIEDAFAFMDYEDPDEFDFEHKLLGEWAYENFDIIPSQGESFDYNGLRITVAEVDQRRIMKLSILPLQETPEEGGDEI